MAAERMELMRPIWSALESKWKADRQKRQDERKRWDVEERKRAAARAALPPSRDGLIGQREQAAKNSHSVFRSDSLEDSGKHDGELLTITITEPHAPNCPGGGDRSAEDA